MSDEGVSMWVVTGGHRWSQVVTDGHEGLAVVGSVGARQRAW